MIQQITSLYTLEDQLTAWLWVFTALVAIGVVIEVAVDVLEHAFKSRKDAATVDESELNEQEPSVDEPSKPREEEVKSDPSGHEFKCPHWVALVGGVLVAIGVSGELVLEVWSSQIETKIRAQHDQIEAELTKSAELAKRDAADAQLSTTKALVSIAGLKRDAAKLMLESEKARKQAKIAEIAIARANTQGEKAKLEAEKEKLERIKLQNTISPRRLTGVQQEAMLKVLKDFGVKSKIIVLCSSFDAECSDLTDDFVALFKRAGWEAKFNKTNLSQEHGIKVGGVIGNPSAPYNEISQALDAAKIVHRNILIRKEGTEPNTYYLLVDHKSFENWVRR